MVIDLQFVQQAVSVPVFMEILIALISLEIVKPAAVISCSNAKQKQSIVVN